MSLDSRKQLIEALESKRIIMVQYDPDWCGGVGYLELLLDDGSKIVVEGGDGTDFDGFVVRQSWVAMPPAGELIIASDGANCIDECEYKGLCEGDPQKPDYCPAPRR